MNAFEKTQEERNHIAEILFRFFYGSFNRFLIFSADPHPGNYLLLPKGKIAFLDYGLVRAVDPGTLKLLVEVVQALIAEDKDRGREALEGIGILSRKTPEIDAVWEHLKLLNSPVLKDEETLIDAPLVQKIAAAGFDPRSPAFQTMRKVAIPGVMVTFNRMSFGVASILGRLEATANWQAMARELWWREPSQTTLGKREQTWLKKIHPEWTPVLKDQPH
jgi:predicted unusual protein kinase regulating ubiquinone biosynthesis (AarF/ABC1/UbiB family)